MDNVLSEFSSASMPWKTRLFLRARWALTPYAMMTSFLPTKGKFLDFGCGHGLLAISMAKTSSDREILGIDHDKDRIALATQAGRGMPNLRFQEGDLSVLLRMANLTNPTPNLFSGITAIDVMHYFQPDTQKDILTQLAQLLEPGGTLLVREVDPNAGWISTLNRFYERLATKLGFTKINDTGSLYFSSKDNWKNLLESLGFSVQVKRCSSFIFSDILFVCKQECNTKPLD